MIRKIARLFRTRTAVEKQRENPALETTIRASSLIYSRIPLSDFISEVRRSELSREIYLEINRICNSREPATVCRERYAATMLQTASFQVLMIPAHPQADQTGLRGQPGITGELNQHLVDLFRKSDRLRTAMFGEEDIETQADYQDLLERLFWENYWLLETLNAARAELGESESGESWHHLFLHAACVDAENGYRQELELSPAFDADIAKEAANAYSMFTDIVMSGAKDPAKEWRDYYQDSGIPMPAGAAE